MPHCFKWWNRLNTPFGTAESNRAGGLAEACCSLTEHIHSNFNGVQFLIYFYWKDMLKETRLFIKLNTETKMVEVNYRNYFF